MAMRNLISWNVLIVGMSATSCTVTQIVMEAFRLLLNDDGLLIPNQVSLSSVLSTCSTVCSIGFGRVVHDLAVKLAVESSLAYVRNSLIDMYYKCGCLEKAVKVFDRCSDRDVVTWNVMMMGWFESDCPKDVCGCFLYMVGEGVFLDETFFLYLTPSFGHASFMGVLSACNHNELVHQGCKYYTCMVDLLGRAGHLDEAMQFIDAMPIHPDSSV
ncbi:hypothetical protein ZIOFF_058576 [Zingiber officinale]|uniref:Pentatricopeptide repeat-containing protein n=1 Tax=Zingiber officinale TaxID=94328 RepID=A0A8J5KJF0_ZINOF|nr:hypothetical protein ZIOFF_058576 [Zingiber officinale]